MSNRNQENRNQDNRNQENRNQDNRNQESFTSLLLRHPIIRRSSTAVSRTYDNARDAVLNLRAPENLGTEMIYFSVYLQIVCLVAFFVRADKHIAREGARVLRQYYLDILGSNRDLDMHDRVMTVIFQPFVLVFHMFMTALSRFENPRETTFSGMHYINAYAGLFMIAIYVAFRHFRRNRRQGGTKKKKRKGGTKRKGGSKTQLRKGTSLDLSTQKQFNTKTQTGFSGTVKIDKIILDKETQNEMQKFIEEHLKQVNKNRYKMSFFGLDLIISIEEDKLTFDTEFSDKEKFDKISKEIFEMNKSLYAETEEDIHNKMNELDKINLELKINYDK